MGLSTRVVGQARLSLCGSRARPGTCRAPGERRGRGRSARLRDARGRSETLSRPSRQPELSVQFPGRRRSRRKARRKICIGGREGSRDQHALSFRLHLWNGHRDGGQGRDPLDHQDGFRQARGASRPGAGRVAEAVAGKQLLSRHAADARIRAYADGPAPICARRDRRQSQYPRRSRDRGHTEHESERPSRRVSIYSGRQGLRGPPRRRSSRIRASWSTPRSFPESSSPPPM